MNNNTKPKKRGKRYALQKARKLDKTEAELLEEKIRKSEMYGDKICSPAPDPVDKASDDAFEAFCKTENYPLFSHLDRSHLWNLIHNWTNRCDPFEEEETEWKHN
jgi:hypothetical protein